MSKVLYIKANAKAEGESRTFQISDSFIETYKANNPNDEIIELDLYDAGLQFLPKGKLNEMREAVMKGDKDHPVLKFAYQFAEADKYVIAEPIWNLGLPAILKAYVDYVAISGITFAYTEHGPVGLLKDKKAVNIITRGGDYSAQPMESLEMADKYLRNIFGFMGITDYTTIATDRLDIITEDTEALLSGAKEKAKEEALAF
ncbi:FMN-dependent NADH-azoreductase [Plebeiibacterium sediminum]|uniref:FMN dependent NADH:quinone oxidoreductase n=1 Tax=Plebeiibacterium sediminum TaxID=2992112 RepID=A0AAE3M662_9BACT|nr:NAD(P)H-dependent oxidoreductase [Plebeiobacterium sediminum]MCW3787889.1 NAD(P)H-dependent oxidoreductase [Plebeiobacterium sediminum]